MAAAIFICIQTVDQQAVPKTQQHRRLEVYYEFFKNVFLIYLTKCF